MKLIADPPTRAQRSVREHLAANLCALAQAQPSLALSNDIVAPVAEWLFGRDGTLTARGVDGQWLAGCSLPRRAARAMLRRLDLAGAVGCFLAPTHASQIAVALEVMRPEQALVVLVPDQRDLIMMLHCENFARALSAHRLWFVAGEAWAAQLVELYESQPGLATPAQFVRVPATEDVQVETLVGAAQRAIADITNRRNAAMQAVRARPWRRPAVTRLCVVAPSRFRLWNDVGHALIGAAEQAARAPDASGDFTWMLFDADDPACSSPLALASVARESSAILTANTARCDLPGFVPDAMPWMTWVTAPRIPSSEGAGPNDHLLLADPDARPAAVRAGWPEARVHVATWPSVPREGGAGPAAAARSLTIVADTSPLDTPEELNEYSSHTLLWESIRDELLRDPFVLAEQEVQDYLAVRMSKMNVADEGFPRQAFISRLIVPAFGQGVARVLLGAKLPLQIFGEGWERLAPFAAHARGPVESRQHFSSILRESRALVHVWPTRQAQPIDFTGVPVVRCTRAGAAALFAAARRSIDATAAAITSSTTALAGRLVREILR